MSVKEAWATILTMYENTVAFREKLNDELAVALSRAQEARGESRDEALISQLNLSLNNSRERLSVLSEAVDVVLEELSRVGALCQ